MLTFISKLLHIVREWLLHIFNVPNELLAILKATPGYCFYKTFPLPSSSCLPMS